MPSQILDPRLTLLLLVVAIPSVLHSQRLVTTAEDFRAASAEDKRFTIIQITLNKSSLSIEQMVGIIGAALDDPNPLMRGQALSTIVSRAGGPWIERGDARVRAWEREHVPLRSLRPAILAALTTDPEPRVRQAAVRALTSLDFDLREGRSSPQPETEAFLVGRYHAEPEGRVRATIVSGFALDHAPASDSVQGLLTDAFTDADRRVRQYAAAGAARLDPTVAMSLLVKALRDPDPGVRRQSALTFAKLGAQVAPHLGSLRAALAGERDPQVRLQIERAIAGIERQLPSR
jgi:HEAT repeat protein